MRRPTFKEDEVERLRQQTLDDLTVELGQPGSIARYVAARVVFGDAPYGQPLAGTPQSIARIDRKDVVTHHGRFYRPDNAILVLGGDMKGCQCIQTGAAIFWRLGQAESLPYRRYPPANCLRRRVRAS